MKYSTSQGHSVPNHQPRICFVGPMVGQQLGRTPSQAEALAEYLSSEGWSVRAVSGKASRVGRLCDIVWSLVRWRKSIDLVALQVYGGRSFVIEDLASRLCRRFQIPVIFDLRGGAMPEFIQSYPRWSRRVIGRASRIISPSNYIAERLAGHGWDIEVVPNAVSIEILVFRERKLIEPKLLWMRAFHDIYDPLMALNAFSRVKDEYPGATLTMAGEDKGRLRFIKQRSLKLGLGTSIRFPGFLDADLKQREMDAADIFLTTTRFESFGVSTVEAAAAGLCIVATRVGEIPYLWRDRENALLVPSGDSDAMATAILGLLGDSHLAHSISVAAHENARQFSWNEVGPQNQRKILETWECISRSS